MINKHVYIYSVLDDWWVICDNTYLGKNGEFSRDWIRCTYRSYREAVGMLKKYYYVAKLYKTGSGFHKFIIEGEI